MSESIGGAIAVGSFMLAIWSIAFAWGFSRWRKTIPLFMAWAASHEVQVVSKRMYLYPWDQFTAPFPRFTMDWAGSYTRFSARSRDGTERKGWACHERGKLLIMWDTGETEVAGP